EIRYRLIRDRLVQSRLHTRGQRLVDLPSAKYICGGRDGECQKQPDAKTYSPHTFDLTTLTASCKAAGSPLASRRPSYSTVPFLSPRSPTTSRCGMPISSLSESMTPGRSSRSSTTTSTPAAANSL